MLPLQFQKPELLRQGFLRVKMGIVENGFDLFQRELQFAKKQDALQTAKRRIVIQPVACRRTLAGDELTALINFAPAPCRLPFAADGCRVLCATGPAAWQAGGGTVCLQGKSAAVFLRSTAEVNLP